LPQTHDFAAGRGWAIADIVRLALDPAGAPRDGVTILGGEPFDQPHALAHLTRALKQAGAHLTLYTGYTWEALQARGDPYTNEALRHADLLIDGPFIASLTEGAGEYRGSRNQRLLTQDNLTVP
jgi:anaerobic ribonucleoside-triphosphate reductase activating protein